MDWNGAIECNREALRRIVAALFAMAGLSDDAVAALLPRRLCRSVLLVLRPAESAVRRLVVIAARDIVVEPRPPASGSRAKARKADVPRSFPVFLGLAGVPAPFAAPPSTAPAGGAERPVPAFRLIDPHKRFDFQRRRRARVQPRVRSLFGPSVPVYLRRPEPPAKTPPSPDDLVSAARLCRRMIALQRALDDLPGQAMRLARLRADRLSGPPGTRYFSPMRPGWPPGRRKRRIHEVDAILNECHALAFRAQERADTS